MGNKIANDRRVDNRFQSLNLISYQELNSEGAIVSRGIAKTLDLSGSGALLKLPQALVHPDGVEVELALAEEILKTRVEIVAQNQDSDQEWLVRVKFRDLKPAAKHRLASFIASLK